MEIQSKQVELHQEKLKETADRLATVQRQYSLGALVRLEEHKRRHTNLTQRLLRVSIYTCFYISKSTHRTMYIQLLRYSQVLRYKGFPLSVNEEQAMNELSQIATQSDNPEQLNKKMLVLWNQLQRIIAQRVDGANGKAEIWRTVSDEDTNMIAKVNLINI
jgi:nuclear pore complex protein Nup54